jgi:hypothetical protein
MVKLTLVIMSMLLSTAILAHEETLSRTDNDDNNEVYDLVVKVNDTTQSLEELYKDTFVNGKKIKRDKLNPDDMKTKDGCILEKRDGYNVLNIKSDNLDLDRGGKIVIDTLYNGVTGERRQVDLELAKDKTGWKLFKGSKIVSKFHVKVNKVVILGTVGIKTIIME